MENEIKKKLLPMGTVVRAKTDEIDLMIVGRNVVDVNDEKYDYAICAYPEGGFAGGLAAIDNEDLTDIISIGYYDTNDKDYENDIKEIISENGISTKRMEENKGYDCPTDVLPIGTVVKTNLGNTCMIVNYLPVVEGNIIRDYKAFAIPNGDAYACIDQGDIAEVISIGYIDEKSYEILKELPQVIDRIKREHNAGKIKPEKIR